jgi:hypothetical protein
LGVLVACVHHLHPPDAGRAGACAERACATRPSPLGERRCIGASACAVAECNGRVYCPHSPYSGISGTATSGVMGTVLTVNVVAADTWTLRRRCYYRELPVGALRKITPQKVQHHVIIST